MTPARLRGRFIAFEGGEGSGKSTQAELLAEAIGARLTREPGGTAVGERIREVFLSHDTGELVARTEALLVAAARAEHVATVIEPTLEAGRDVVCDRFSASSVAYQGYGRGLVPEEVAAVSRWASGGLEPDLIVLLDVPPEVAAKRLDEDHDPDRVEAAGDDFHRAVAKGFRTLAAAAADRWLVLDGTLSIEELAFRIRDAVETRLPR
jgi:dTMP kinase